MMILWRMIYINKRRNLLRKVSVISQPKMHHLINYHLEVPDLNTPPHYSQTSFQTKQTYMPTNTPFFQNNSVYQHDFLADDSMVHHQMMSSVNACGQQQVMFYYSHQPQSSTSIEVSNRTSYTWDPNQDLNYSSDLPTTSISDFNEQYFHDYNN